MSLYNLARQVQSRGRGDDSMLVHMTPGEVQGLQALAMKHGGSLSINPETGLPEAGFLKRVLPSVIGGIVGVATMNPMLGAAVGGGLGTAMSGGNLKQGIMSGIGAYGFGSLGAGLAASGSASLGAAAAPAAELAGTAALDTGLATYGQAAITPQALAQGVAEGTITPSAANAYGQAYTSAFGEPSTMSSIQEGFKQAAASPGAFFKQNMFPIGAAALSTMSAAQDDQKYKMPAQDPGQIRPYTYTQERNPEFGKVPGAPYFTQSYTAGAPYAAKEGGIIALASGGMPSGPVERMAMKDMQPGMYPQGMMDKTEYATPTQRPASMEVIKSDYDVGVNPMTGMQDLGMAGGGIVALADGGAPNVPPVDPVALAQNLGQYTKPAPTPAPAVAAYNQILADRAANEYVTQPAPLTMLPGGGERATPEDTRKLINQYYVSQLGRQGDQPGLDYWAKQKAETGMSLADINKAIGESGEANIRNFYKQNYDRYATPEEIASVQQRYASGEAPEQIMSELQKSSPKYKAYESAPITKANFDAAAYLAANPDIKRFGEYEADPFLHYERHGKAEGRAAPRVAFQPTPAVTPAKPALGGYTYDQATGTFTKTGPSATQLPDLTDEGLISSLVNRIKKYEASQGGGGSGGGKAGGLMPYNLKSGGISDLGDYSDGGRLLKGPGDGVSDSIPAQIGARQPARLADGEFVVPARIVSELGNGSTDAGARKLYAMMDRIQKRRKKSIGKDKVAVNSRAESLLPA